MHVELTISLTALPSEIHFAGKGLHQYRRLARQHWVLAIRKFNEFDMNALLFYFIGNAL